MSGDDHHHADSRERLERRGGAGGARDRGGAAAPALHFGARYESSILCVAYSERSYRSLRQVVTTAMDLRDRVTGGHSDRVVELSLELGRGLGLPEERLHHLEWA